MRAKGGGGEDKAAGRGGGLGRSAGKGIHAAHAGDHMRNMMALITSCICHTIVQHDGAHADYRPIMMALITSDCDSMQVHGVHIWTIDNHDGPNHLGLCGQM